MPDAADIVAAADTLAEAGLYSEAVSAYTRAIDSNRSAPQYYVKRYLVGRSLSNSGQPRISVPASSIMLSRYDFVRQG